jgi:NADH-quinone oxidoreductase subunit L
MQVDRLLWLIPALPLAGSVINGFFGNRLARPTVGTIAVLGPLVAFVLSVLAFLQAQQGGHGGGHDAHEAAGFAHQVVWTWISAGDVSLPFGLQADRLSAVMMLNVTGIGAAIHLFSYGYMKDDPSFARFMAYLNLFLAAMLILVMGDNLVLLFVGWEGVGLCSYLLIGFWYDHPTQGLLNVDAGRKAFIVNRVGDLLFLIGTFILFSLANHELGWAGLESQLSARTLDDVLTTGPLAGWTVHGALVLAGMCLFGGATGKSAQIPLYVWLPDAMAGPTPVSALIHAATMVTAGVYLLARLDFLYVHLPAVAQVIAIVAASTAVLSGVIACAQNDIKKVLAYSTISQLGFMFCGMATTVWESGMFHVVSHAFFKALLFLGAGAVIHALHEEQDMRKMGGLWHDLRPTAVLFLIGALALAGVFPFSGFFSKDEILAAVYLQVSHEGGLWTLVLVMLLFAALLTAFYTTRLVMMTFFGRPHDRHRHLHPPHWTMLSVLALLAFLSLFGGALAHPFAHYLEPMWSVPAWRENLPAGVISTSVWFARILSTLLALGGIALGVVLYGPKRSLLDGLSHGVGARLVQVVEQKFYVDELYRAVVVAPMGWVADRLWAWVDRKVIDQGAVEGPGKLVIAASAALRHSQVGVVSVATAATLAGSVLVLLWMVSHG